MQCSKSSTTSATKTAAPSSTCTCKRNKEFNACYAVSFADGKREYGAVPASEAKMYYEKDASDNSYKILDLCFTDKCNNPTKTTPLTSNINFNPTNNGLFCRQGSYNQSVPVANLNTCYTTELADGSIMYGAVPATWAKDYVARDANDSAYKVLSICSTALCNDPSKAPLSAITYGTGNAGISCYSGMFDCTNKC